VLIKLSQLISTNIVIYSKEVLSCALTIFLFLNFDLIPFENIPSVLYEDIHENLLSGRQKEATMKKMISQT
jgi:hypothetical protein